MEGKDTQAKKAHPPQDGKPTEEHKQIVREGRNKKQLQYILRKALLGGRRRSFRPRRFTRKRRSFRFTRKRRTRRRYRF